MVIVKILVSFFVFVLGWKAVKFREPEYASGVPETRIKISCAAAIVYMIVIAFVVRDGSCLEEMFGSLFWASIALCAWCDYLTTEIYDFCYLPALIAGVTEFCIHSTWHNTADFMIFAVIQFLLFQRLFGISDCIAYCVCALYMLGTGKEMLDCVRLMLYTHVLFSIAQLLMGNINRKIKLKEPKPLIPYIVFVMSVMSK